MELEVPGPVAPTGRDVKRVIKQRDPLRNWESKSYALAPSMISEKSLTLSLELLRLTSMRPFTEWSDSGNVRMPPYCWSEWMNAQVHRIHDLMDINTLRLAKVGIDPTYKPMVWNLVCCIDRREPGSCSCDLDYPSNELVEG